MTQFAPEVVFWCLVAGLVAALVLLLRQHGITRALRRHATALEDGLRARDQEARHLVEVRLPALQSSQHQPGALPGLLHDRLAGTSFAESLQTVIDLFSSAADRARSRADQSAKAALKASMRALQGLANEQQLAITDMQDNHDSPHVLQDLLEIDHANAQFGRRAQGIAVLCGSWPGRQRAASPLVDVVRGAKSRIRDYRRVEVSAQVDLAVVSRAVEPVVLTVAELLDNAARHSQPNTQVEVTLRPAHNGTAIVIDDAGVGMDSREIQKASMLLAGRQDIDINRLGDPPQFGFAVIGVLAARYGFTVSVDTRSPYGGVRAVVFLPKELLTSVNADHPATAGTHPTPAPAAAPRPAPAAPQAAPARPAAAERSEPVRPEPVRSATDRPEEPGPAPAATALGLPKRRRRAPVPEHVAATRGDAAQQDTDAPAARPAHETASRMSAFARGTRSGRLPSPDDEGTTQE
ncbi:ATP-binding protein [Streptomyces zingiberis]|uniref:histidine kinase n=1 Tax=Streptomyces zingiberis TaxID=2053010 RepID=A0ABX1BV47_9ACTN|nr:ATP-binding protein [Streptomyces zingiberis]NJQ01575.1 sensor histidine kinase [Streptomyces zingiberis]